LPGLPRASHRLAFTLLELLIVCVIIGVALGIAAPRIRSISDSLAVEAAARSAVHMFATARLVALRDRGAELRVDADGMRLLVRGRIVRERQLAADHGVRVRTTVTSIRYAATGLGLGLSNGTVYITRGRAADTIVVSRLGRVRR
jgi:prepilin-type N-terminal cleavage/methylation domain-containing protein